MFASKINKLTRCFIWNLDKQIQKDCDEITAWGVSNTIIDQCRDMLKLKVNNSSVYYWHDSMVHVDLKYQHQHYVTVPDPK